MQQVIDFQDVFEHSPNCYMLLDAQLRYVAANPAYLRATGSRLEQLLGRHILEAFPNDPDDPNNESARLLMGSFDRTLRTGEADVLALIRYRVPVEGAPDELVDRYWSATHTPIRGTDGRVEYILQHTVDVTELQLLRDAAGSAAAAPDGPSQVAEAGVLRRARQVQKDNVTLDVERRHLLGLFEQAPGFMTFVRGPEHVFEIANPAYYQLVGHRDILGKTVREALPDVEGQGFFELLDRVFETGEPFVGRGLRLLLQREPGAPPSEAFLDFIYQPIFDSSGATAGILAQGYDITAHKKQEADHAALLERERQARAAAEEAEARQRFLAESIPQQVWTALPNGDLDFVNTRVLAYFNAGERDVLGSSWTAFVHPDDVAECATLWGHSLRTGDPYEVAFRLRRADDSYRWHLARAVALRDAEGRIAKWFGTNTDTDELTRARDTLEKRAEFDQQLIGIVSHDLRNPLNAIGMATALLMQRGRMDEQHVKIVRRIMSSSERAVRLIRDFLDFTHARVSGRIPVTPGPANIREIAAQAFEEVHLMYPDRAARVEHTGEETGQWDLDRIAQVVSNLVSNAFQHGSASGPVVLTTLGTEDEVVLRVRNDGAPIPPHDIARLFEPFQRGAHATTQSGRSVGLGLYITKQIVNAHGGTIEVESAADAGTCFTVRLPRSVAPQS